MTADPMASCSSPVSQKNTCGLLTRSVSLPSRTYGSSRKKASNSSGGGGGGLHRAALDQVHYLVQGLSSSDRKTSRESAFQLALQLQDRDVLTALRTTAAFSSLSSARGLASVRTSSDELLLFLVTVMLYNMSTDEQSLRYWSKEMCGFVLHVLLNTPLSLHQLQSSSCATPASLPPPSPPAAAAATQLTKQPSSVRRRRKRRRQPSTASTATAASHDLLRLKPFSQPAFLEEHGGAAEMTSCVLAALTLRNVCASREFQMLLIRFDHLKTLSSCTVHVFRSVRSKAANSLPQASTTILFSLLHALDSICHGQSHRRITSASLQDVMFAVCHWLVSYPLDAHSADALLCCARVLLNLTNHERVGATAEQLRSVLHLLHTCVYHSDVFSHVPDQSVSASDDDTGGSGGVEHNSSSNASFSVDLAILCLGVVTNCVEHSAELRQLFGTLSISTSPVTSSAPSSSASMGALQLAASLFETHHRKGMQDDIADAEKTRCMMLASYGSVLIGCLVINCLANQEGILSHLTADHELDDDGHASFRPLVMQLKLFLEAQARAGVLEESVLAQLVRVSEILSAQYDHGCGS